MAQEEKRQFLIENFPPGVGEEVMSVNSDWYISWEEQERRIDALIGWHESYKEYSKILPDYRDIIRYFENFGAPTSATKAGISRDDLRKTLLVTKDFRKRYSISQALSELGMIEACTNRILEMEDSL